MTNKSRFTLGALVATLAIAIALIVTSPTVIGAGQNVTIAQSSNLSGYFGTVTISGVGTSAAPIIVSGGKMKCLVISGQYIVASGMEVTGCQSHGAFISGKHVVFQYSNVHDNVLENKSTGATCKAGVGSGWGSAVKVYVGGTDIMIRGNQIHHNCGEGIGVTRGVEVDVIDNYVWDNFSVNIYIDNSYNVGVTNNVSYCRDTNYKRDGNFSSGILLGIENYSGWGNQLHDVSITGNTVDGCRPIRLYSQFGAVSPANVTITNNTFVGVPAPYVSVAGSVAGVNLTGTATVIPATPFGTVVPVTIRPPTATKTVYPTLTNVYPDFSPTFTPSRTPSPTITPTFTPTKIVTPSICPSGWFTLENYEFLECLWVKNGTLANGYPSP